MLFINQIGIRKGSLHFSLYCYKENQKRRKIIIKNIHTLPVHLWIFLIEESFLGGDRERLRELSGEELICEDPCKEEKKKKKKVRY